LYDDNGISIDGQVAPWFADNTPERFKSYGWNVIGPINGHDAAVISQAIASAKLSQTQPTLIVCKTSIGKGSPNRADTAKAHGEPLGAEEIALTRAAIGWNHAPFEIPKAVYADWNAVSRGKAQEAEWKTAFAAYKTAHPTLAKELQRLVPRPPSAPPPGVLRGSALTPKAQQDQQEMPPPPPKAERPEPARANTELPAPEARSKSAAGIRSTGQEPSRQESVRYGMPEPQEMGIEIMQWCRNIEAEHMAIVRANNYHWLRVFELMDYMGRRLRGEQSGLS
jgi:hypothetical protein